MNKILINSPAEFENLLSEKEEDWLFGGDKNFNGMGEPKEYPVMICYDWERYEDTGNFGLIYSFVYLSDFKNA